MADVTERAQLILVTGFALAFTLVAIVLLLNTVIYTENIASRGMDRSADQAIEFRDSIEEGLGDTMVATNLDTAPNADSEYRESVTNLSEMFRRTHLVEGTLAIINESTLSLDSGFVVRQTDRTRNFTSGGTDQYKPDWRLASDVSETRRSRFHVSRDSLESADITNLLTFDPFGLRLDGTSANWTVYIYENSGDIVLATDTDTTSPTRHCSVNAAEASIILTGNGIEGETCSGYEWADGISSPYSIHYLNGDRAEGSYNLTVNTDLANIATNHLADRTGPDPRYQEAVYSATVRIRYETPSYIYETTIEIAPGDPDDG